MIKIEGIFSESFGGTCTFRGYSCYDEIIASPYAHTGYQRKTNDLHVNEISDFIVSGSNSFSPEIVLAYTAKYDYYKEGASSDVNAIEDIRSGKGFISNINGVSFKKIRKLNNGYLYEMSLSEEKYSSDEKKPFRRIDGNHRLNAIENLIRTGQMKSTYLIPICIVLFADDSSLKDEKVIFHNINSKAVPLKSEELLNSIIVDSKDDLNFSDNELKEKFGKEYLLVRNILSKNPLIIRKLHYIDWIKDSLLATLLGLIKYVQLKTCTLIETSEQSEAFTNSLDKALSHADILSKTKLSIASGMLFLLTHLYYEIVICELDPNHEKEKYKDCLCEWSKKYNITSSQIDSEENASINADCIKQIFDNYMNSQQHTIFLSRCFNSEYDETEHTIQRAIDKINSEKHTAIKLIRVDKHNEGHTDLIPNRIFNDIKECGLVIADLSSGKPNIPHEIGYAMGLKKDLILVHNGTDEEADKHTPSNISMYEQLRFNGNYTQLEEEIKKRIIDYYKL